MARLRLEFLSGPRRGDASVFSASTVSLGRSRSNTFVLSDTLAPGASGRHAEFLEEDGAWWLVDCNSTNGTFLNGARIHRSKLAPGDRVTVGELDLGVDFVEEPSPRRHASIGLAVLCALLAASAAIWFFFIRPGSPQHVADMASGSVYLVAIEQAGSRRVVGTAFAIDDDGVLATNAHVAAALQQVLAASDRSTRVLAIRGDTYDAHAVASVTVHPDWHAGSIAHDVAVLRLAGSATSTPLPLASSDYVAQLRRGTALAAFGFPAVSTDPAKPRGRLSVDVLSDVRLPFLEVGLGISPGTSGSPVFGPDGTVVAVVVSGDFVGGPPGAPMRPSGSNVNWAISVDELRAIVPK